MALPKIDTFETDDDPQRKAHGRKKLTPTEARFVNEVTREDPGRPTTITDAFRNANPSCNTWDKKSVTNSASRIYRQKAVQAAIEKRKLDMMVEHRRTSRITKAFIENRLVDEATNADKSSDRIAALRALAAMQPDEVPDDPVTNAASKEDLVNRLEEILSSKLGTAIDVTPELQASGQDDSCKNPSQPQLESGDDDDGVELSAKDSSKDINSSRRIPESEILDVEAIALSDEPDSAVDEVDEVDEVEDVDPVSGDSPAF